MNCSIFASTRSVQIATIHIFSVACTHGLCLHTLRADCNLLTRLLRRGRKALPPHAPCRLQHCRARCRRRALTLPPHAPCRLQQPVLSSPCFFSELCLHTLRADCNLVLLDGACNHQPLPPHAPCRLQLFPRRCRSGFSPLPPHAPCRLQRNRDSTSSAARRFASTRSVQIATMLAFFQILVSGTLPPHAPCRLQHEKAGNCPPN